MKKHLAMFALAIFLAGTNAIAQTFSGTEASVKIPGASVLKYKTGSTTPSFIRLSDQSNISVTAFDKWITGALNLGKSSSFKSIRAEKDALGFIHHTFQYYYNGYPVEGAVYKVHVKNGRIESVNGTVEAIKLATVANTLSEKDALNAVLKNIQANKYMWESKEAEKQLQHELENSSATHFPKGTLVVVKDATKKGYVLAYKFDVYASEPIQRYDIFVNASTGKVEAKNNKIQSSCFGHHHNDHRPDDVKASTSTNVNATGTAVTKYSGTKSITTDNFGGSYRLRETGRGTGIETYDLNNATTHSSAVDFTDADNFWNDAIDNPAYDAHWGAEVTYDYYMSVHGRNSFDNAGAKMLSYIHYGTAYDNAFWDGSRMTYGDGSNAPGGFKALTSLDVVGHEFTHGVTSNSADLIYAGESGALNESFSDIFGTVIEFAGKPATANFLVGEDVMYSGGALRSMSNPNAFSQPDTYHGTMWDPAEEVHANSGVGNFWFYLLCQGGTGTNDNGDAYSVSSIGMVKAAAISYRSLTVYLTPSSTYADARESAIMAAGDIYGDCSPEVQAVTNAWHAVGVGAVYTNVVNAEFFASMTEFCTFPATVSFFNQSSNAQTMVWNFGDGSTSTLRNPVHTYNANGSYTVSLTIDGGACGGTDVTSKSNFIVVNSSLPCPTTIPSSGVGTVQTACSGTLLDEGGMLDYHNDVDGSITISPVNAASVTLNFTEFNLENTWDYLYVYDGPNTSSSIIGIYTGTSLPNGGTITSSGPSITIRQDTDGSIIRSGFICRWSCTQITTPPIVNFKADKQLTCVGLINFSDLSTLLPTSWSWNFGDGATSTERNPTHVYSTSGVYTVSLVACNSLGCSMATTKTNYITVTIENCVLTKIPATGTGAVLTACAGTLYDSGGESDYADYTSGKRTIAPANGSSVTLSFESFSMEGGWDYLYVYDGASENAPLIGRYSGSSLPEGGIISSTGNAITLVQTSDGSYVYSGFVINWSCTTGMNDAALADVETSIYPNPANNDLNVQYGFSGSRSLRVTMYNVLGTAVFEDAGTFTNEYKKVLDVKAFTKGLYTITVADETGARMTNKVVVE